MVTSSYVRASTRVDTRHRAKTIIVTFDVDDARNEPAEPLYATSRDTRIHRHSIASVQCESMNRVNLKMLKNVAWLFQKISEDGFRPR